MTNIVGAHGFGVQKDDRGLFPDIAAVCLGHTFHMVDLNDVDSPTGNLVTPPLDIQAERLVNFCKALPKFPKIIVAHSMGCLVACLAEHMSGMPFNHMVFITPPVDVNLDRTIVAFKDRPGSVIDVNGTSILMRRDGTKTIVPPEFWVSKQQHDPQTLYAGLECNRVDFVIARQDEVLGDGAFADLPKHVQVHMLDGDHNFSSPNRAGFLAYIAQILT